MHLWAGDSGADGPDTLGWPETPVLMGRRLRASAWTSSSSIWAAVLAQISQIRGEIGKLGGWKRNRTGSNHSNDEILGSKPQETHTIERSIRDQFGAFYEIF